MHSRILNFFNPKTLNPSLDTTFTNFYAYIYNFLEGYSQQVNIVYSLYYALLVLSIVNSFLMIFVWIYNTLKMNQKRFDIMIWFLDIPTDYVAYLGNNCTKFLKGYITIKEL